jgi:hypothetical protein
MKRGDGMHYVVTKAFTCRDSKNYYEIDDQFTSENDERISYLVKIGCIELKKNEQTEDEDNTEVGDAE